MWTLPTVQIGVLEKFKRQTLVGEISNQLNRLVEARLEGGLDEALIANTLRLIEDGLESSPELQQTRATPIQDNQVGELTTKVTELKAMYDDPTAREEFVNVLRNVLIVCQPPEGEDSMNDYRSRVNETIEVWANTLNVEIPIRLHDVGRVHAQKVRSQVLLANEITKQEAHVQPFSTRGMEYLQSLGYEVVTVPGDGSCLFHSVAYSLVNRTAEELRERALTYMQTSKGQRLLDLAMAEMRLPTRNAYLTSMRNSWEWGGNSELNAMAEDQRIIIVVFRLVSKSNSVTVHAPLGTIKDPPTMEIMRTRMGYRASDVDVEIALQQARDLWARTGLYDPPVYVAYNGSHYNALTRSRTPQTQQRSRHKSDEDLAFRLQKEEFAQDQNAKVVEQMKRLQSTGRPGKKPNVPVQEESDEDLALHLQAEEHFRRLRANKAGPSGTSSQPVPPRNQEESDADFARSLLSQEESDADLARRLQAAEGNGTDLWALTKQLQK